MAKKSLAAFSLLSIISLSSAQIAPTKAALASAPVRTAQQASASGERPREQAEVARLNNAAKDLETVVQSLKAKNDKFHEKGWSDPTVVLAVSALFLSICSLAFSFYQFRRNRADTLCWKERDMRASRQAKLLDTLSWFEGGIQKRATGIAVIEGHWSDQPELQLTWASILVTQAVYILDKPEPKLPQHEVSNLTRIFALLKRAQTDISREKLGPDFFSQIHAVLKELPIKITQVESKRYTPQDRYIFMRQVQSLLEPYSDMFDVPALPVESRLHGDV